MLAPDWTWWDTAPVFLATVVLLWLPGVGLAAALGARWWPSVAVAPVLTGSLVVVGGVLSGWSGIAWRPPAFLVWLLGVPALAWGVRLGLGRAGLLPGRRRRDPESTDAGPPVWAVVAGLATAGVIGTCVVVLSTGAPGNIPQGNDTIYHLGLVRAFVDSGNISALTADAFNHPAAPAFYPALLQGLAASVVMLTHAPGPIAVQAVLLAATALVWPLGLMFLVRSVLPGGRGVVYLTGALSWAFAGFPANLLGYGPVWPVVLGYAYAPAALGVLGVGLRHLLSGRNAAMPWVLLALTLPGLVAAHVSALFVVAIGAAAFVLATTWRLAHGGKGAAVPVGGTTRPLDGAAAPSTWSAPVRRWAPFALVLVGVIAGFAVLTVIAPSGMVETAYGRTTLSKGAVAAVTLWGPPGSRLSWSGAVLLLITVLGAVAVLRRRAGGWLALCWIGLALLGFFAHVVPADRLWPLTWPWYNVPARIQGASAVFGVPLAAYGASALLARIAALRPALRRVGAGLVGLAVAVLIAVQTANGVRTLGPYYTPREGQGWISAGEADALRRLSAAMPADAVVAADPFTGAAFLGIVGPQRIFIPTEKASSPDIILVADGLTRVQTDPLVCHAVQRQHITYVITGGRRSLKTYDGIHLVSPAEAFVKVAQEGPYTLWRVPTCEV